jgi:type IV pilus assembly protein PilA
MKSVKCSECGFVGWADSDRCKKCGVVRLASPDGAYQEATPSSEDYQPEYHNYQSYSSAYSNGPLKKGMAVASLVIGILGFFTLGILGVGAVIGIVLAVMAMGKAKRNPYEYGGQGVATAGLVMNILSVVIVVPVGIIAAIAIPNLLAARRAANEGATISVLRKIHSAEATYQATAGNGSYGTMDQLVSEQLLPMEMGTMQHFGYKFNIEVEPFTRDTPASFKAVAVPVTYGNSTSTGTRSFYVDESGVIRGGDDRGAEATERDEPLNSDVYSSTSPGSRRSYSNPAYQY